MIYLTLLLVGILSTLPITPVHHDASLIFHRGSLSQSFPTNYRNVAAKGGLDQK